MPRRLGSRFWLALVALLWAVALWFYAREEMSAERDIEARLDFTVPEGRILKLLEPPAMPGRTWLTLSITVKGPRRKVYALEPQSVHGRKILDAALPAVPVPVALGPADFDIAEHAAARIVAVRPSSVQLLLAETASKVAPVRVIPVGEPKKGYVLSKRPRTSPPTVEVRAAAEVLEKVAYVETEAIDISGKEQPLSVSAALVPEIEIDGRRHSLFLTPERVFVLIDITPAPVVARKEHVPVRVLLPAGGGRKVTLEKGTLSLSVSGSEERVAALKDEDIKVFVDASSLPQTGAADTGADALLPLKVVLPAGIELVPESAPKELRARVEERRE